MNKNDIKTSIIESFGHSLISGKDYLDCRDFNCADYTKLNSLHSDSFYEAVSGGGYELQIFGKVANTLHFKMNSKNSNTFVLRERPYTLPGLFNQAGKSISEKKVDIVCIEQNRKVAGIEVGQRRLFENFDYKKVMYDLNNLPVIGFEKSYFVLFVTDVNLKEDRECLNKQFKFSNHLEDYEKRTDDKCYEKLKHLEQCLSVIDDELVHLVFKSNSVSGYASDIYINAFIIELPKDKKVEYNSQNDSQNKFKLI